MEAHPRLNQGETKTVSQELVLWSKADLRTGPSRLMLVTPRRLGSAVRRNRTKRLFREAFRLMRTKEHIVDGREFVLYPRPGHSWKGLGQATDALKILLKKAGFLKSPGSS